MLSNKILLTFLIAAFTNSATQIFPSKDEGKCIDAAIRFGEKELMIPAKAYRIPENNDYANNESEYSFARKIEGPNIAIFWHKEFGDEPWNNPNEQKKFDSRNALKELEQFYHFYVNVLKLVEKGNSLTDKYLATFP